MTDERLTNVYLCPWCGYKIDSLDAASLDDGAGPEPGEAVVCEDCGNPALFGPGMMLVKPAPEALAILTDDPNIKRAKAVFALRRDRAQGRHRVQ